MKKLFAALLVALGVSVPVYADVGPTHTGAQHTETLHIFQATWREDGTLVYEPLFMTFKVTPWTCEHDRKFYRGPIHNLTPEYQMIYIRWCE